ncbi:hypothetical protein LOD99_165 [Oopsacas minuta]|uniref:Ubiquitin-like domain-containing protein n=1 Tax=Oopsacas minuta TaxID=111878 RepID=A0AAV7K8M2_9METZ|nr:hypothetical protein LOD99_165 [Oopsacas minuta]
MSILNQEQPQLIDNGIEGVCHVTSHSFPSYPSSKIRAGVMLYIKTFQGNTLAIEVDLDYDTVAVVKNKIEDKIGISKDEMILVFNDNDMSDERSLRSYGLKREDTMHLVPKRNIKAESSRTQATSTEENTAPPTPWWKCNIL